MGKKDGDGNLSTDQVARTHHLLETTDLSLAEIAGRIKTTRSTVSTINQKAGIREYTGKHWVLSVRNKVVKTK